MNNANPQELADVICESIGAIVLLSDWSPEIDEYLDVIEDCTEKLVKICSHQAGQIDVYEAALLPKTRASRGPIVDVLDIVSRNIAQSKGKG